MASIVLERAPDRTWLSMEVKPGLILYFRSVAVRVTEVDNGRAKIIRASRTGRMASSRFGKWVAISMLRSEHKQQIRKRLVRQWNQEAEDMKDFRPENLDSFQPTEAMPGTPEKLEILAKRR